MDYQTFKMELLEQLRYRLGSEVELTLETVPKNNGIFMEGVVFGKQGASGFPVIYLEDYYLSWKKGMSVEQLTEKILWNYRHFTSPISLEEDFFGDYEKLKSHIFFQLINYEKNRRRLKSLPHRRFLDLAVVFYYRMEQMEPAGTVMIQNVHLQRWGITREELEKNAKRYTCLNLPAEFLTMESLAESMDSDPDPLDWEDQYPLYILTNRERQLGAGAILYPGILEQARNLLGDHFYVLPSSIHECILVSADSRFRQEELSALVADINRKYVDVREVLSDHAYYYLKKDGKIHI